MSLWLECENLSAHKVLRCPLNEHVIACKSTTRKSVTIQAYLLPTKYTPCLPAKASEGLLPFRRPRQTNHRQQNPHMSLLLHGQTEFCTRQDLAMSRG